MCFVGQVAPLIAKPAKLRPLRNCGWTLDSDDSMASLRSQEQRQLPMAMRINKQSLALINYDLIFGDNVGRKKLSPLRVRRSF